MDKKDLEIQNLKNYIEHQKLSQENMEKLTSGILNACRIDDYIKEDIKEEIERILYEFLDPTYCETCGSCGESGCCNPSNCETVKCLYGDSNAEDYKLLLDENEDYRNRIQAIKNIFDIIALKLLISDDIKNEITELLTLE